jgi:hypothetical protein
MDAELHIDKVARREGFGAHVRLSATGVEIYEPPPWWRRLWARMKR